MVTVCAGHMWRGMMERHRHGHGVRRRPGGAIKEEGYAQVLSLKGLQIGYELSAAARSTQKCGKEGKRCGKRRERGEVGGGGSKIQTLGLRDG